MSNATISLTAESMGRIALLSFKEGYGKLTSDEKFELESLARIDTILSGHASMRLNDFMCAAYILSDMIARGEA